MSFVMDAHKMELEAVVSMLWLTDCQRNVFFIQQHFKNNCFVVFSLFFPFFENFGRVTNDKQIRKRLYCSNGNAIELTTMFYLPKHTSFFLSFSCTRPQNWEGLLRFLRIDLLIMFEWKKRASKGERERNVKTKDSDQIYNSANASTHQRTHTTMVHSFNVYLKKYLVTMSLFVFNSVSIYAPSIPQYHRSASSMYWSNCSHVSLQPIQTKPWHQYYRLRASVHFFRSLTNHFFSYSSLSLLAFWCLLHN